MTGTNKPPLWILIDATNAIHRDAYGCGVANAAATLGRRIATMDQMWQPSAIVAAFDSDVPTFRHEIHPQYKAGRKRLEGIDDAIAAAKDELGRRNIACMTAPGFEADDIIATIAEVVREDGGQVLIYSADKDLHQLLVMGEVTQLLGVKRHADSLSCQWMTACLLQSRYKVRPDQWVDWKVLVGDPSDNIAGVRGIGPETASNLLMACGSLDGFYKRPFAAPLSDRQRVAAINAKPWIPKARQLCTLRTDATLPELWKEGV